MIKLDVKNALIVETEDNMLYNIENGSFLLDEVFSFLSFKRVKIERVSTGFFTSEDRSVTYYSYMLFLKSGRDMEFDNEVEYLAAKKAWEHYLKIKGIETYKEDK